MESITLQDIKDKLIHLVVLGGEGVGPHAVGEVGVLFATVAALVALVFGKVLHNGKTGGSRHVCNKMHT